MNTIIVWLLIVSGYNANNVTVIGKFATAKDCQFVSDNLPDRRYLTARCIQSTIVKE